MVHGLFLLILLLWSSCPVADDVWNIIWKVILWGTCGNFFAASILGWLILWLVKSYQYSWPCFERLGSVLVCYKHFGVWIHGNSLFPLGVSEGVPSVQDEHRPTSAVPSTPPCSWGDFWDWNPCFWSRQRCAQSGWWKPRRACSSWQLQEGLAMSGCNLQPWDASWKLLVFQHFGDRGTFLHSSGSCSVSKCFSGRICSWKNICPSNCTDQVQLVKIWKGVMASGH